METAIGIIIAIVIVAAVCGLVMALIHLLSSLTSQALKGDRKAIKALCAICLLGWLSSD